MTTQNDENSGKYYAFISYSHQDKETGDWLHKALEVYKVPKALIGQQGRDGVVPKRLFPIFRDREELPTSADLGGNIRQALEQSRYLIVICSPNSAASQWVNEEILAYKRMGRENRILCLIVDGEPNATDKDQPDEECFPEAVRYQLGVDGNLSQNRTEPIAADARPGKDGKNNALLKLLAGLLGVNFDQLRQRERQRQRARRIWMAVAATGCLLIGIGTWQQFEQEKRDSFLISESQRINKLAGEQLNAGYPDRALLLALNAMPGKYGGERPFVPEVRDTLIAAMNKLRKQAVLTYGGANAHAIFSGDHRSYILTSENSHTYTRGVFGTDKIDTLRFKTEEGFEYAPAVLNSDGTKLLLYSREPLLSKNNVLIQDMKDPGSLSILQHVVYFNSLVISPDGKLAAITDSTGKTAIWDLATGKQITRLEITADRVNMMAYSADSKRLATAGYYSITIWDVNTGKSLAVIHRDATSTSLISFSPSGEKLISCSDSNHAVLWNLANQKMEFELDRAINYAEFSPDGKYIATTSLLDSEAVVWNANNGEKLSAIKHKGYVNHIAFSRDGTKLVTASDDKTSVLWSMVSGQKLATFVHDEEVKTAFFSDNDKLIVTQTAAGVVTSWAVNDRLRTQTLTHEAPLVFATYSPDGKRVVTASMDNSSTVWGAGDGRAIVTFHHGHGKYSLDGINYSVFSPDGTRVLTSGFDQSAIVWDALTGKRLNEFRHDDIVGKAVFSPDGKYVITGSEHGAVLWDVVPGKWEGKGKKLGLWVFPSGLSDSVAFSHNGKLAATASGGVWTVPDGKQFARFDHTKKINSVSFSPNDKLLLVSSEDNTAVIWEIATKRRLGVFQHSGNVRQAAFNSDGKRIITASSDGTAVIWDVSSGKKLATFSHKAGVDDARFSHDGKRVVTASEDHTAIVWDVASHTRLATLEHSATVLHAEFSPADDQVLTASEDYTAGIWGVPTEVPDPNSLIDMAIRQLPRNRTCLSSIERDTFALPELNTNEWAIRGCQNYVSAGQQ